jgi:RNA polymerase sigma factor (sigma-70 family)
MDRQRASASPAPSPGTPRSATGGFDAERTFEHLFFAEHERLFRALYLITGNSQESEELMQDAFLKVWERWDRVQHLENPAGYLCRTAINGARSRYRQALRTARNALTPGLSEDPFAAADLRDGLVRALRTITPRQRAALVLTELMDLPSEEAARALGVTAGTVRSLASQARAALRIQMEEPDG